MSILTALSIAVIALGIKAVADGAALVVTLIREHRWMRV